MMLLKPFIALAAGALLCAYDDPHDQLHARRRSLGGIAGAVIGNNVGAHNPANGADRGRGRWPAGRGQGLLRQLQDAARRPQPSAVL